VILAEKRGDVTGPGGMGDVKEGGKKNKMGTERRKNSEELGGAIRVSLSQERF